jgi:proteasome lid subunit RPN8/RPN11
VEALAVSAYWSLPTDEPKAHYESPLRVWFSQDAQRQLRAWPLREGVERAGALFGRERHGLFVVERVELADKFREMRSVSLDTTRIDYVAARLARSGLRPLGSIHSHPSRGAAKPSRADLRSWTSWLRSSDEPSYIGAIISPNQLMGFDRPDVTAFILQRSRDGKTELAATVEAEFQIPGVFDSGPPRLLVARESRHFQLNESASFTRGDRIWSDDPRAASKTALEAAA